jgi:hypothetical protein
VHFGLYRPDGRPRPAAGAAVRLFEARSGQGDVQQIEPDVERAEVIRQPGVTDLRLLGYLGYGLGVSLAVLTAWLVLLLRRGGRSAAPRRPARGRGAS